LTDEILSTDPPLQLDAFVAAPLAVNVKVVELSGEFGPFHQDITDTGAAGPLAAPVDERLDVCLVPLETPLDIAVGKVAYPAVHLEADGVLLGEAAEVHSLHEPFDGHLGADFHLIIPPSALKIPLR